VPSWMVGVSASADLPLHHKVHKFSHGTGSPGWSQKKGCKMVVARCGEFQCLVTSGYPDGSAQGAEVKIAWKLLNNNSHPAVLEQDCPEINSSQRWCLCKTFAHVVWSHGDLGSSRAGNGWLEMMRRNVLCNWNKASLLLDGKTRETTILSSQTTLWTTQTQRRTFRLGRRLAKQGPRPLSRNQGRVEKSVTGQTMMKESTILSQGYAKQLQMCTKHRIGTSNICSMCNLEKFNYSVKR